MGCSKHVTYRPCITQKSLEKGNDTINVPILLYKPETLAPRQISDNIECKILQPLAKAASPASARIQLLGLVEEYTDGGTYERFVINERAHGEGIVDAAAIFGVVVFIGGGKEGLQAAALGDGILNGVEVGLLCRLTHSSSRQAIGTNLRHALI